MTLDSGRVDAGVGWNVLQAPTTGPGATWKVILGRSWDATGTGGFCFREFRNFLSELLVEDDISAMDGLAREGHCEAWLIYRVYCEAVTPQRHSSCAYHSNK